MMLRLLLAWIMSMSSHAQDLYRVEDQKGGIIYTDSAGNIPSNVTTVQPLERHTQSDQQTLGTYNKDHFLRLSRLANLDIYWWK